MATALPIVNGWTVFTPSADSRLVYVSASSGSDTNSGLSASAPKRSLAAGYALLRDGMPDWLLLKSDDSWHEVFPDWIKTGRSSTEPMRIGSYGTGEAPTLYCGTSGGLVAAQYTSAIKAHLALTDVSFVADGYNGSNSNAAGVEFLGSWSDVLLENVRIKGFFTNLVFQADRTIQTMQDIRIRRCIITDSYRVGPDGHSQGCYLAGIDRLTIEECNFDHNGWNENVAGATPTIFRHNIYIQGHAGDFNDCTNVVTRGIISARAGATGMQQRPGGLAEDHLFLQNPLNMVFGTAGGTINRCTAYDSRDIDPSLPRGVGFNLVDATPGATTTLNDCLAMIRTFPGTDNIGAFCPNKLVNPAVLNHCIAWRWKSLSGAGVALDERNSPPSVLNQCNLQGMPGAHDPLQVRTLGTYLQSLGIAPGADPVATFMAEARKQSRANWRAEFTPKAVNAYLWGAWESTQLLWADKNHNGVLDEGDFGAFLALYAAGSPEADANGDGRLNVADFTAFLQRYAAEKAGQVGGL